MDLAAGLWRKLEEAGIDPRVRAAMQRVPRHEFVPEHLREVAYEDEALPIGYEQTISQPSLVGLMTEKLEIDSSAKVLEVGTGSGYQTAILAELAREVWSVEIVPELFERTRRLLARYSNVHLRRGDGYAGLPDQAPFDGIIVTASAPRVPRTLVDQLRIGAHLVIPVERDLLRITRDRFRTREEWICGVTFVPMTGAIRN